MNNDINKLLQTNGILDELTYYDDKMIITSNPPLEPNPFYQKWGDKLAIELISLVREAYFEGFNDANQIDDKPEDYYYYSEVIKKLQLSVNHWRKES